MLLAAVLAVSILVAATGCSKSTQLADDGQVTTTFRVTEREESGGETVSGGSDSATQMQIIIDRLLASSDACAILTQRDIRDIQLDPTAMASSAVRQVVATGVVDVYNHLAELVTEPTVNAALIVQRDTFAQVLAVVERYSNAPTSDAATSEISALAAAPEYIEAEATVNSWVSVNCG